MRTVRFALFLAAALALSPAASAQTCGGALTLPLGEVQTRARGGERADTLVVQAPDRYRIVGEAVFAERGAARVVVAGAPSPDSLRARHPALTTLRDTLASRWRGLFAPRRVVEVWTRCGLALLRFTVRDVYADAPMVLDLYNVPAHVGIDLAPVEVRPGRWVLDFEALPGPFRAPVPASAWREVEE